MLLLNDFEKFTIIRHVFAKLDRIVFTKVFLMENKTSALGSS